MAWGSSQTPRCPATCWKGDPDNPMAENAKCKWPKGHAQPWHMDKNGNTFTGSGKRSKIRTIR